VLWTQQQQQQQRHHRLHVLPAVPLHLYVLSAVLLHLPGRNRQARCRLQCRPRQHMQQRQQQGRWWLRAQQRGRMQACVHVVVQSSRLRVGLAALPGAGMSHSPAQWAHRGLDCFSGDRLHGHGKFSQLCRHLGRTAHWSGVNSMWNRTHV
jgi:hypothetical protein